MDLQTQYRPLVQPPLSLRGELLQLEVGAAAICSSAPWWGEIRIEWPERQEHFWFFLREKASCSPACRNKAFAAADSLSTACWVRFWCVCCALGLHRYEKMGEGVQKTREDNWICTLRPTEALFLLLYFGVLTAFWLDKEQKRQLTTVTILSLSVQSTPYIEKRPHTFDRSYPVAKQ